MAIETAQSGLQQMRAQAHANCVVCSPSNERGLQVNFAACGSSEVRALFECRKALEGYAGMLHGGVIASLIDGAMTNCLFAHGVSAVTAELAVRFRHPVLSGGVATVRAWIARSTPRLCLLKAEIVQNKRTKVTASGKFLKQTPLAGGESPQS